MCVCFKILKVFSKLVLFELTPLHFQDVQVFHNNDCFLQLILAMFTDNLYH